MKLMNNIIMNAKVDKIRRKQISEKEQMEYDDFEI